MEEENVPLTLLPRLSAQEILRQSPFQAIRRLRVEENEIEIIVSGTVSSYYLKQQAQESLLPFLGSRRLRNCVEVVLSRVKFNFDDDPES